MKYAHIIILLSLLLLQGCRPNFWKQHDPKYWADAFRIDPPPALAAYSSDEMQAAAQCFSRCNSISYECINSEKIEKSEPQCEEEKQICFQQCDNKIQEGKKSEFNPGMESCD
ncbi:MAG: hypothetical protein IH886_04470 [Nitrospinae bacterium]|nr:hypothetical protein [Nitrospinota bacterium]